VWEPVSCDNNNAYELLITNQEGNNVFDNLIVTDGTSHEVHIPEQYNEQTLFWQVRAKTGNASWSEKRPFNLGLIPGCPAPRLISPAPDARIYDPTVRFEWELPGGDCSDRTLAFRIKTIPAMECCGHELHTQRLDQNATSVEYTFGPEWEDREVTIYWSVWRERERTHPVAINSFILSPNQPPIITFDTANGDAFPGGTILSNEPDWEFVGTARDPEGKLQSVTWFCSATGFCGAGSDTATLAGERWSLRRTNMAGENDIYFIARDDKHRVVSRHLTLRIDRAPPVTTFSINGEANPNRWPEWFNKPAQVRLQAIDGTTGSVRAGVAHIHFRIDNGPWQIRPVANTTFTVQGDGTHTIEYYAVDTVGNAEKSRTITIKLDTTPPSPITGLVETHGIPNNVWQARNVATFEWAASTDTGSGVAGYQFSFVNLLNGSRVSQNISAAAARRWSPYQHGFISGHYVLRGQAIDRAGNRSAWKDLYVIKYDNTPPVNPNDVLHRSGVLSGEPQNQTRNADFTWTAPRDIGAGADGCYIAWGLEADGVGGEDSYTRENSYLNTTPICGADERCTGYFRLRCQDKAGNLAPAWTTGFQLVYRQFLDPESKNYRLAGYGVSVGAGQSVAGNLRLNSTVGQSADAAVMTSDRYRLASGYQATRALSLAALATHPETQATSSDTCAIPRISINADALATSSTNVTLTLCATGAEQMMISNAPDLAGAQWEPFVPSRDWTIKGDGSTTAPRVVYTAFQYADGTVLQTYMDDIIYDPDPPIGQVALDASASRTLALTAQDEGSGVARMQVSPNADFSDATWEAYTSTLQLAPTTEHTATTLYIRFRDHAGNVSKPVSIDIDTQPPTGSIAIDAAELGPRQDAVTLILTAQDNLGTDLDMRISEDSTFAESVWQPFTPTLTLPISPTHTNWGVVYAQYRDPAGNESVVYGALYGVDTNPPEITAAWLMPGDTLTHTLNVRARDLFTGMKWLHLSNDPLMLEEVVTLPYTQTVTWTLDEREVVWVQVEDEVGNRSRAYPATVRAATEQRIYLPLVGR
jgi:hypothetical protein